MPAEHQLQRGGTRQIVLIVVAIAVVGFVGVPLIEQLSADRELMKPYDFVQYWSAGRQLLDGRDPYDPDELFVWQRSMYDLPKTVMMWNPPWTLPLTLPFAAMPWRMAQLLWFVMQLGAVLLSADLLWRVYRGDLRLRWIAWLLALAFAPTLFLLLLGQISGLPLLGLAGFVYYIRNNRPYLAGCCAVLTAIKPHLLPLFALVLVLESTHRPASRKAIAVGAALLLLLGLLPLLWNTHVWNQYLEAMRRPPSATLDTMRDFEHPTIGYQLRLLLPGQAFETQFIPALFALSAYAVYWWRQRPHGNGKGRCRRSYSFRCLARFTAPGPST